jgi:hypothetical protein
MWCVGESSSRKIWFWGSMDSTTFEIWQFLFCVRRLLFSVCFRRSFPNQWCYVFIAHAIARSDTHTHTHKHSLFLSLSLPVPSSICIFISMCNRTNLWCINSEPCGCSLEGVFCVYLYMYCLSCTLIPSISQMYLISLFGSLFLYWICQFISVNFWRESLRVCFSCQLINAYWKIQYSVPMSSYMLRSVLPLQTLGVLSYTSAH